MKILIKNASIITMSKDREIFQNANIGIENTTIKFIGDIEEGFNPDKIIDSKDKVVMPGMNNSHTHIPMSLLRNYADDLPLFQWLSKKIWPIEDRFTSEHVYLGSMLSIAEMIKGGTTAFCDMYFGVEEIARAVDETGIRAAISRGMMGEDSTNDSTFSEVRSLYRNYYGAAEGRITVMAAPHAPYTCSDKYIHSIMNLADELNIPMHMHLSETREEVKECLEKYGKSPIEHMEELGLFRFKTLAAHCVHLSDKDIDIIAKNKVSVANNPGSNLKLGSGFAPVKKLLDKGINVALGTDGAASNNNQNMFEEMNLASILNKALCEDTTVVPAIKAIEMATINGAKAMGLDENTGSIEVGKKADLIIVDFNKPHLYPRLDIVSSIVYSAQASDVSHVIVNGKVLLENYELKTIDFERIIHSVDKVTKNLY
ncbi:amidohydrolase [Clostridium cylindrosporum]|uniref:5-methylthioadenosine/S-adenosylhomocysteine deaminase n=1 Tax=Clostridium cylindrosporum DSM 605 TaxID=1121307 RepID=A0A0J8D4N8_CLOCY|nr:amidohydrolase [Clostridium cylindrosporum]KMT21130.1 5-methylthioadenosine/S-adenosylhomocysteine deaminase [Clostridium cylindrosporum DSM 605]